METIALRSETEQTRVAVPYYGNLTHPRTGLTHLYFLVEVEQGQPAGRLQLGVWNRRRHPRLGDWLKEQKVSILLCREREGLQLEELQRGGVQVLRGERGDPEEMVARLFSSVNAPVVVNGSGEVG